MNATINTSYTPADDDNQGVTQLMAQGAAANDGVSQVERMNPVVASTVVDSTVVDSTIVDSGPEPVKEEINDDPDSDASPNDDELAEEEIEANSLTVNGAI
ncbi:hypothetical protein CLV58_14023 [Spirosoma oryzae]|uniref:Uncharacterized protein n=1 Tax=Spirosoma oryzae TaxID=1469603 RepID=A0A2T0RSG8_9BACT|nr:hypothetical protein [Spirosoma oryzae]PRY24124.1 hypothetical protein CLV58_14023 [Spirosoma oryzae]